MAPLPCKTALILIYNPLPSRPRCPDTSIAERLLPCDGEIDGPRCRPECDGTNAMAIETCKRAIRASSELRDELHDLKQEMLTSTTATPTQPKQHTTQEVKTGLLAAVSAAQGPANVGTVAHANSPRVLGGSEPRQQSPGGDGSGLLQLPVESVRTMQCVPEPGSDQDNSKSKASSTAVPTSGTSAQFGAVVGHVGDGGAPMTPCGGTTTPVLSVGGGAAPVGGSSSLLPHGTSEIPQHNRDPNPQVVGAAHPNSSCATGQTLMVAPGGGGQQPPGLPGQAGFLGQPAPFVQPGVPMPGMQAPPLMHHPTQHPHGLLASGPAPLPMYNGTVPPPGAVLYSSAGQPLYPLTGIGPHAGVPHPPVHPGYQHHPPHPHQALFQHHPPAHQVAGQQFSGGPPTFPGGGLVPGPPPFFPAQQQALLQHPGMPPPGTGAPPPGTTSQFHQNAQSYPLTMANAAFPVAQHGNVHHFVPGSAGPVGTLGGPPTQATVDHLLSAPGFTAAGVVGGPGGGLASVSGQQHPDSNSNTAEFGPSVLAAGVAGGQEDGCAGVADQLGKKKKKKDKDRKKEGGGVSQRLGGAGGVAVTTTVRK